MQTTAKNGCCEAVHSLQHDEPAATELVEHVVVFALNQTAIFF